MSSDADDGDRRAVSFGSPEGRKALAEDARNLFADRLNIAGWNARGTSVATLRRAACSSASRRTASRESAFAMAVAIEFGELLEPFLRSRQLLFRSDRHCAPQPAFDGDRV